MGVVGAIVRALHTSHKAFAEDGIHSRPLAELLLELDGENYLSESDRQDVIEKSATLSQVRVSIAPLVSRQPSRRDFTPQTSKLSPFPVCYQKSSYLPRIRMRRHQYGSQIPSGTSIEHQKNGL